jgi:hypothetical protein
MIKTRTSTSSMSWKNTTKTIRISFGIKNLFARIIERYTNTFTIKPGIIVEMWTEIIFMEEY